MQKFWNGLKQNFWPISAIIFCPCHLPLTMSFIATLTAGTMVGTYLTTYYNSIESTLAVIFSFYFVLAFMIWVVRGPQQSTCAITPGERQRLAGLSTKQIVTWGVIGMLTMPALVAIGLFTEKELVDTQMFNAIIMNMDFNSGLIWLVSIATVVMIPIMVIWLVWLWLAWAKADPSQLDPDQWSYEYE